MEGVDQLETYFGAYLPQFFMPCWLRSLFFAVLSFVNIESAVVLLVCVPLIPAAIAGFSGGQKKAAVEILGGNTPLSATPSLKTCRDLPPSRYTEPMNSSSGNERTGRKVP